MAKLIKIKGRDDWHGSIRVDAYQFRRARYCRDKATSEQWHLALQVAVDRRASGEPLKAETRRLLPDRLLKQFELVTETSERRRGTFADNVGDYVTELRTAGRNAMYVTNTESCLLAVGTACGWKTLRDMDRTSFVKHIERCRVDGVAPRTLNNTISTLRSFCRWCVDAQRLADDPLASVKRIDQTGDRRRKRRALSPDEAKRLLAAAGPRALVYRFALGTGLRRRELRDLQWRDVRLDAPQPFLLLRPEATKSKRADELPLPPHLAEELRAARPEECLPTAPVFPAVPNFDTWTADVKRAGITYRDAATNEIVGFHSMRVTFISELERAGVLPRTIMELARHTDYRLTAGTYTDRRVLDTFGAVMRLPDYGSEGDGASDEVRPFGVDVAPEVPRESLDQIRHQIPVTSGHNESFQGTSPMRAHGCNNAKTPQNAGFGGMPRLGIEPRT